MDKEQTYPILHRFAALFPVLDLLEVAMKFATCYLDYVPTVREDALIPGHVDCDVLAIILPLIELIKEALVGL
jgi:hypothetical protein